MRPARINLIQIALLLQRIRRYFKLNPEFLKDNNYCKECGEKLNPFEKRAYAKYCKLCQLMIDEDEEAKKIASELGEDNDRKKG